MKQLLVPLLTQVHKDSPLAEIAMALDELPKNPVNQVPWPAFAYKPSVSCSIAHHHNCLFIKYYVTEEDSVAVYRNTNDPVYRDSCVELFISFNQEAAYYNLEFNKLGTANCGFGLDRTQRQLLPATVIEKIKRLPTSVGVPGPGEDPQVKWELTICLPAAVFCFHTFSDFSQQQCRVNLYKCGDDLPKPHFLAWNQVYAPSPDFHRPEYFGEIKFL